MSMSCDIFSAGLLRLSLRFFHVVLLVLHLCSSRHGRPKGDRNFLWLGIETCSMICRRHAAPCTGRRTTWGAPRPRWSTTQGALRPRWNSVVATGEPFVPAEFWTSRAEALLLCFREPLVACMSCCRCCACRCSTCACLLVDGVLVDAVDACRVLDALLVDVVLGHACL